MTKSVKLRFILAFFLLSPAFLWGQTTEEEAFLEGWAEQLKKGVQEELNLVLSKTSDKSKAGVDRVDSLHSLMTNPETSEEEKTKVVKTLKRDVISFYARTGKSLVRFYRIIRLENDEDLDFLYKMAKIAELRYAQSETREEAINLLLDEYYRIKEEKK